MAKEDKEIGKAMEKLGEVSEDEHLRYIAELREKAIKDEISGLNGARAEGEKIGEKIGEQIGEQNKAKEIAKNMLAEEFDIETIERITKLTKEEIRKLK